MTTIAHITVGLAPVLLAAGFPFLRVARGGSMAGPFFACWGLLVFWFGFFSVGIPLLCGVFSRELARVVATDWVPEPPGVAGVAFFGWFWAAVTVLLARGTYSWRKRYAGTQNT